MKSQIIYPYIPDGKKILYVAGDNVYMRYAHTIAKEFSLDAVMPNASVLVKNGAIIGKAANGSNYHQTHKCQRIIQGCKTGEGYELCEGCHPKNHSEIKAIENVRMNGYETNCADLYLWGHWWCCRPCWECVVEAGVANVYLLENSEKLFNKEHPQNIVGKQFREEQQ